MNAFLFVVVAVSFLSGCAVEPLSIRESGVSGLPLIDNLNVRYQRQTGECTDGTPAYYCSGVMLRTTNYSSSYPFWTHSPGAKALGSLTFSYIRSDIGTNGSDIGSGFIFSDQETAVAQNKAPVVRCIYPFMAGTQNAQRPGFGCGFAPTSALRIDDQSTCATLATPAITAELWIENFRRFGSNIRSQCSLSTQVASQFQASLQAHNGVDAAHTATRNELLIATWPEETPEELPIEAFFYNASLGGLLNAQSLRHAYALKTSLRLPIVRVDFSVADRNIFSLREADQVDGWDVAAELNARYNDLTYECAGQAAYYCNGVLARMVGYGAGFHSWNPNPSSKTAVSFSFWRRDMKMTHAVYGGAAEQGFVFRQAEYYGTQGIYPLVLLCSFPYDGGTSIRADKGCGDTPGYFPVTSRPCSQQGINTVAAWSAHYFSQPVEGAKRFYHQCGFESDQEGFALSLLSRVDPQAELPSHQHNEVLIDTWPQNSQALPIEAFIYIYDQSRMLAGLAGAQFIQKDYYRENRIAVPVVSVAFRTGGANIFSYHPSDQAISY